MKVINLNLLLCFFITACSSVETKVVNLEHPSEGQIQLAEGIAIDKINSGYTLWYNETRPRKGMLVFFNPRRDEEESSELIDYCLENDLAVLYATTDNRLEFLFKDEKMEELHDYLKEVIQLYDIPRDQLLYCGMSLAGTRALKMTVYGNSHSGADQIVPKAIAICDAPLDMLRFFKANKRAAEIDYNPIASNEGYWVSSYLEANLGNPANDADNYINYSPYTYQLNGGLHLNAFENTAIRAYTEPDVNWWIKERRKSYYGMNAIDMAAFVNELKIRNHPNAELITTQEKGFLEDGKRHPHSWSIVDEAELIDWFLAL
ncbi:MAG: hypothetical protein CMP59_06830 [Flavobacteriales bacterium]|nr:hypothetical protein [Flavobacteriales bacterium]